MRHKSGIFFVFGAWLSFVGLLLAGSAFIPKTPNTSAHSLAATYRALVREELHEATTLPTLGKVIAIDQTSKKIFLYEDGVSRKEFHIKALASAFSFYEVPTGSYVVSKKEPQHLMRNTRLWVSYATLFGDNFFIHGTLQQENGENAADGHDISVELSTFDAKEVYDFASVGTKIIATGGHPRELFPPARYYLKGDGKLPSVTSPAFIIADIDTKEVLWERRGREERMQGKLVSFATALTLIETLDQYKDVRIGELLLSGKKSQRSLPSRDDELPLGSLIYPLLFDANQTAGEAIVREFGNTAFTAHMNQRVQLLGMHNTRFASSTALHESTTTAQDLFQLLGHIYQNEHFLLEISLSSDHALFASTGKMRYQWENKNPWVLRGDADYRGGLGAVSASGAGSGMFLFKVPCSEFNERTIAFVLLDSSNLEDDVMQMRKFIREHYQYGTHREYAEAKSSSKKFFSSAIRFFHEEIIYDSTL